jgi:hypothetical protein
MRADSIPEVERTEPKMALERGTERIEELRQRLESLRGHL